MESKANKSAKVIRFFSKAHFGVFSLSLIKNKLTVSSNFKSKESNVSDLTANKRKRWL